MQRLNTARLFNAFTIAACWIFLTHSANLVAAPAPDANKLLEAAEKIRNPPEDYRCKCLLADQKKDKKETRSYEVLIKGRTKALVRFLTPPVDQGTQVLMVDDQMWTFVPSTAKPIRISPRQRLTGNAAYGDITRLNFVGNYTAKLNGENTYNGRKAYVLDLTAIEGRPVTYDQVEYWVDQQNNRPLKALYKTSSGKTLREGYFDKYENVFGVERPTEFKLVDFLEKDHTTILLYKDLKKASLPDLLFEKQNLGRES